MHSGTVDQHDQVFDIIVLGAGVVGLTTALEIQQRSKGRYKVTIVSDIFPGDPNISGNYTSQWAGANHLYNSRDRKMYPNDELFHYEKDTFKTLWELSEPGNDTEEYFLRIQHTHYYYYDHMSNKTSDPEPMQEAPFYKSIPLAELPPGVRGGCTFQTITIDVPFYLNWLLTRFTSLGGKTVRGHVQHLTQIIQGGVGIFEDCYPFTHDTMRCPHAVVVCTGLSTRYLGGVEDLSVYPVRGQTVLIRAPWINFGVAAIWKLDEKDETVIAYTIPRRSGDVIIGGTWVPNDWYPLPREETTTTLLSRIIQLCPELAPPEIRAVREPKVEDLLPLVIRDQCGFRPARTGGIRIEKEWWNSKGKLVDQDSQEGKSLVVYNYGHAGYGYQSSWGTARKAADLLEDGLKKL